MAALAPGVCSGLKLEFDRLQPGAFWFLGIVLHVLNLAALADLRQELRVGGREDYDVLPVEDLT